jgi:hypothetical protein
MPQYVLLLRDEGAFPQDISPQEIQAIIERYRVWGEKVRRLAGEKLRDGEGRILRRSGVTDGPFTESKDVVGGYFIIEASDYEDALRKCRDCPHLDFGSIEIRQIEAL